MNPIVGQIATLEVTNTHFARYCSCDMGYKEQVKILEVDTVRDFFLIGTLDKKSPLRNYFETYGKDKNYICKSEGISVHPDGKYQYYSLNFDPPKPLSLKDFKRSKHENL